MTRPRPETTAARAALRRVEARADRLGWPPHEAVTADALVALRAALEPRPRGPRYAPTHPGIDASEADS